MGSIRTRLQTLWWSATDVVGDCQDRLRGTSGLTKVVMAVVALGVTVVVIVLGLTVTSGGDDSIDDPSVRLAVATNADLPANLWTGWTEQKMRAAPAPASPQPNTSALPSQCEPGGQLQQNVQRLGVDATRWAGSSFLNVALSARMVTMVAANDRDIAGAVDAWSSRCAQSQVKSADKTLTVQVKQLPVTASTYRLSVARVVAQTVAPAVAGADAESTALTAVGRSGRYVTYVELTFPGALTNDAVSTLDTLWRAQAAKLVAYQQTGEL